MIQVLKNSESKPKTCENGIQGVSFAGLSIVSTPSGWNTIFDCEGIHTKANLKPCNERPPWKASSDVSTGAVQRLMPPSVV